MYGDFATGENRTACSGYYSKTNRYNLTICKTGAHGIRGRRVRKRRCLQ